jgi:hypothetical protein
MSITYYSIVEKFFAAPTGEIDSLMNSRATQRWNRSTLIPSRQRASSTSRNARDELKREPLRWEVIDCDGPGWSILLLTEERSEDPLIVSFDPVISQH